MEEIYNPQLPNIYYYREVENLEQYVENITQNNENISSKIYICAYQVNNNGKYPFLQFLFEHNSRYLDQLVLPEMVFSENFDTENIKNYSTIYLFHTILKKMTFSEFTSKIIFNGFHVYNNELYLFYDLTNIHLEINDVYRDSPIRFCLINEILNSSKLCDIPISQYAYDFFTFNYNFCLLTNEKDEIYETPIVGYVAKPENKLNFSYVFGETIQKDKNAILGPYFYFTSFKNAVKLSYNITSNSKSGIVRFALFLGKLKYIENKISDPIDESDTKKERLLDTSFNLNLERLTMRITDYDGTWADNYDSVYLAPVELDDGSILEVAPLIVLKEYSQQLPLSYHYINRKYIDRNESVDHSKDYKIL